MEALSGAEIRTEGDSFYVTFPSASSAVAGALAIVSAAAAATADVPSLPIAVGIGVHAGETEPTDEGPVGSAVNIAARLAAMAGAGEVLVTETVRALTRTSGRVRYIARGTRRLKGIAEPIAVYSALPLAAPTGLPTTSRAPRRFSSRYVAAMFGALTVVVLAAIAGYTVFRGMTAPSATPSPTVAAAPSASTVVTTPPSATPTPVRSVVNLLPAHGTESTVALAPGTYRAAAFRPPFELTVDEGWAFRVDSADPGYLHLQLADRPTSGLTFINVDRLPTDACANNPPAASTDGVSLTSWLREQPGLTVGASVVRLFGSIGATQLDVAAHDDGACELGSPRYVSIRPFEVSATCCTGFQLNVGEVARAYSFDLDGARVSAWAVAPTQEEADILFPKVGDVLGTVSFDPIAR